MESYLSKKTSDCLSELISYVTESKDYKKCQELRREISKNKDLMKAIARVRKSQKEYVQSYFSKEKEEQMNKELELLNNNKTYILYLHYLDKVNMMLEIIKSELNDYFYNVTNIL